MWSWLAQIDPNVVVGLVVAVGTFAWRKLGGDARELASSIVDAVIDNFVLELLASPPHDTVEIDGYIKRARTFIEARVWGILAKRGVKKTKAAQELVHAAIERATAELRREILNRRKART